jgi:hypothetical protein
MVVNTSVTLINVAGLNRFACGLHQIRDIRLKSYGGQVDNLDMYSGPQSLVAI